jgi:hypothetical protein
LTGESGGSDHQIDAKKVILDQLQEGELFHIKTSAYPLRLATFPVAFYNTRICIREANTAVFEAYSVEALKFSELNEGMLRSDFYP